MDDLSREVLRRLDVLEDRLNRLETTPAIPTYALLADAGSAGRSGRIIYVEDDGKVYRDNGATWDAVGP